MKGKNFKAVHETDLRAVSVSEMPIYIILEICPALSLMSLVISKGMPMDTRNE